MKSNSSPQVPPFESTPTSPDTEAVSESESPMVVTENDFVGDEELVRGPGRPKNIDTLANDLNRHVSSAKKGVTDQFVGYWRAGEVVNNARAGQRTYGAGVVAKLAQKSQIAESTLRTYGAFAAAFKLEVVEAIAARSEGALTPSHLFAVSVKGLSAHERIRLIDETIAQRLGVAELEARVKSATDPSAAVAQSAGQGRSYSTHGGSSGTDGVRRFEKRVQWLEENMAELDDLSDSGRLAQAKSTLARLKAIGSKMEAAIAKAETAPQVVPPAQNHQTTDELPMVDVKEEKSSHT